ncbi:hypothetical protein [Azohydromonas australica]|uniref:hypothetical protein n=1 Tax=Azohydromonas australica TaxID=364039 RepID=UPI0006889F28|nr:hypothetical protein [Azohydromonas australica]
MVQPRLAMVVLLAGACGAPTWSQEAVAARIADVALPGAAGAAEASPSTIRMFTESESGGIQRVVAKDAADEMKVRLVRRRLRDIRNAFLLGDVASPSSHPLVADLPARLRDAAPGRVLVGYRDIPAGGELTYYSRDAGWVNALHGWFDTLASDPSADAVVAHLPGRRRPVPSSR